MKLVYTIISCLFKIGYNRRTYLVSQNRMAMSGLYFSAKHDVGGDCTGRFIMISVITNIYNKKTKGPNLIELFTATGKLIFFFLANRDVRCVHHG